jgi:hypothetical protein
LSRIEGWAGWRRSSRCVSANHCVEVSAIGGLVEVRNSRNKDAVLRFDRGSWRFFVREIQAGALDGG